MLKTSQKDAVYSAISNVLKENKTPIIEGVAVKMTKELRAQVNAVLFEGFKSETIELDKIYTTDSALKGYISGLQSNWLRKDKRLNGGTMYIAKNPGSRAGSGDPQLKALRALLTTDLSVEDKAEVQSYIDARVSEIGATKTKKVAIDYSALPADLQSKFSK